MYRLRVRIDLHSIPLVTNNQPKTSAFPSIKHAQIKSPIGLTRYYKCQNRAKLSYSRLARGTDFAPWGYWKLIRIDWNTENLASSSYTRLKVSENKKKKGLSIIDLKLVFVRKIYRSHTGWYMNFTTYKLKDLSEVVFLEGG